jgi:conjugative relaxase-like TrwC/TraI family protein
VLNIGVLAPDSEQYYLGSVAGGVEDYYLGGEVPGRWVGHGAELLGLAGEVDGDDLVAVLADRDPVSGTRLGCAANRKVPGFDLTFSTPKTVSILFGLGEPDVARVVRVAHEEAVDGALGYLERWATWSRRGRNGVDKVTGDGLVGAAFRHRTSRAGDPHLHTHVLVANTVRGSDGHWRTLDFRHVFAHAKTAGYLYEANLRHLLTNRLGVEWRPVHNGTAELVGVPDRVVRLFSTRRMEIEVAMAARGETSAHAAQIATLATRRPKDPDVDAIHLRAEWARKASEAEFEPAELGNMLGRRRSGPTAADRRQQIENHLASPAGLTERTSTFDRLAVLRAWCDHLPNGAAVPYIEELTDRFLTSHQAIVPLADGHAPLRTAGGRVLSSVGTGCRWSTQELLDLEDRLLTMAAGRVDQGCAVVDENDLTGSFHGHPTLSNEQARVVAHLCCSGNGIDVVTAPAGSGKTFTVDAARDAWERGGYRVIGTALAARAAAELQAAAGVPSTTLDSLLIALEGRATYVDARTVMVVDEAGMVGTRKLARLLDHAAEAAAKVVLVGDPRQLPEIDAGGLLAGLAHRLPGVQLTENRRQRDEWERHALRHLRDGDIDTAIGSYRDHGRITLGDNAEDTRARLVADWWGARLAGEHVIMLAERRSDVDDLNRRARTCLEPTGRLHGPTLLVDGVPFQAGDEIITLRNDRRLHVRNGERGAIEAVDPVAGAISVALATGAKVVLPTEYLTAGHIAQAYATTVHKAQGLTCDRAFTLGSDSLYREQGYVAMSRGRLGNHLYVVGPKPLDLDSAPHAPTAERSADDVLLTGLTVSRRQSLAVDHTEDASLLTWATAELLGAQCRLRDVLAAAPEDCTHDSEALGHALDRTVNELTELRRRHDELAVRPRTWRERRRGPDPELLLVEAKQAELVGRRSKIEDNLETALSTTQARQAFLADHEADARRLDQITGVLADRVDRAVRRAINDAPGYLTRALGPCPTDGTPVAGWIDAATLIETYRLEHGITDKRSALGRQPRDPTELCQWQQASWDLEALLVRPQPIEPDLGIDLGL